MVRGQDNREGKRVGIKACGVRQGGRSRDPEGIFGRRLRVLGARASQPRGGDNWDQGLWCEARRAVSGSRGDFYEEDVSAWCEGRTA